MRAQTLVRTCLLVLLAPGCTVPSTVRLATDGNGVEAAADTSGGADALDAATNADGAAPDALAFFDASVADSAGSADVAASADTMDVFVDTLAVDVSADRALGDGATTDARDGAAVDCSVPDRDGDGHAAVACGGDDCGDADRQRFPGNFEQCDLAGRDEDCDPATLGLTDYDGDGVVSLRCCAANAAGALTCGTDCDDVRGFVHPGGTETCNGFDDNCDGAIDEGFARMTYYYDADGDQYGDPRTAVLACVAPLSHVLRGGDCNDAEETIYPGHGCP